jgi:hypothetical protein
MRTATIAPAICQFSMHALNSQSLGLNTLFFAREAAAACHHMHRPWIVPVKHALIHMCYTSRHAQLVTTHNMHNAAIVQHASHRCLHPEQQ